MISKIKVDRVATFIFSVFLSVLIFIGFLFKYLVNDSGSHHDGYKKYGKAVCDSVVNDNF